MRSEDEIRAKFRDDIHLRLTTIPKTAEEKQSYNYGWREAIEWVLGER